MNGPAQTLLEALDKQSVLDHERYRAILRSGKNKTPDEIRELQGIVQRIGISHDDIDRDIALLAEVASLTKSIGTRDAVQKAFAEVATALENVNAHEREFSLRRKELVMKHFESSNRATQLANGRNGPIERIATIKKKNPRIFNAS